MHIFIDESGSFAIPTQPQAAVSCVAALVVPDLALDAVESQFRLWKRRYGHHPDAEVKGSSLGEREVASLVDLLRQHHVVLKVCGVDMGLHTKEEISSRKEAQASDLTQLLPSWVDLEFRTAAENYATAVRRMPNQLFVQMTLNLELLNSVLDTAPRYFGMRFPAELGAFHWVVDAKDKVLTTYEDAWRTLAPVALSDRSFTKPRAMLPGVDYSHMDRAYAVPFAELPPEYRARLQDFGPSDTFADVGRLVWDDFHFRSSTDVLGLQLVDIVANAIRRALRGRLRESGWQHVGRLFVDDEEGCAGIRMVTVRPGEVKNELVTLDYAPVLHAIAAAARVLPTAKYLEWLHSGRPDPFATTSDGRRA